MSASGLKVNPHGLRVCVIKDWDSRWKPDSHIPKEFLDRQKNSTTKVVGQIKDWNIPGEKRMKNVPRKKPHHK